MQFSIPAWFFSSNSKFYTHRQFYPQQITLKLGGLLRDSPYPHVQRKRVSEIRYHPQYGSSADIALLRVSIFCSEIVETILVSTGCKLDQKL